MIGPAQEAHVCQELRIGSLHPVEKSREVCAGIFHPPRTSNDQTGTPFTPHQTGSGTPNLRRTGQCVKGEKQNGFATTNLISTGFPSAY